MAMQGPDLKPQIAPDAAHNEHIGRAAVRHCALGDLHQHREQRLLRTHSTNLIFLHALAHVAVQGHSQA